MWLVSCETSNIKPTNSFFRLHQTDLILLNTDITGSSGICSDSLTSTACPPWHMVSHHLLLTTVWAVGINTRLYLKEKVICMDIAVISFGWKRMRQSG